MDGDGTAGRAGSGSSSHPPLPLQIKYDANQQARKHLLPLSAGDLGGRGSPEKPQNGALFPGHGEFLHGRQTHPGAHSFARYDV